jgi:CHAT domain-containing protein/tetratricopeptide (TPR) repeat protein
MHRIRLAMLALLVLADDAPGLCAPRAVRPSMAESFSLGSGGDTLCQVESTPTDALAPGLFDRAYAIVCRDAAAPVGHLYALSADRGDPGLRLDEHRDPRLRCLPGAGAPMAEAGTAVTLHCTAPDGLSYDMLRIRRAHVLYAAEGLSGYSSALELGLRSLVADRVIAGAITISRTGAGDAASFARAQAGSLDPAAALAEGYRHNNSGSYAEASEFFDSLLQAQPGAGPGSNPAASTQPNPQLGEYLVNRALQQSDLGNYAEADTLFARADRVPTSDPVELRLRRNYRAIHLLNQDRLDGALQMLGTLAASDDAGAATTIDAIDPATAAALNERVPLARQLGISRNVSLSQAEKVAVLDAQALALRGRILRLQGHPDKASAAFSNVLSALDRVRDGRVASVARLRSQVMTDQAVLAEAAGDKTGARALLQRAVAVLVAEYPDSIVVDAANATLAGFLARNGDADAALALYRRVVTGLSAVGGASSGMSDLLDPYFALLVDRIAIQPVLADDLFLASQVLLRPGVADTQAVLARELSGGSGEAGRMFRQSLNEQRRDGTLRVELARLIAIPTPTPQDRSGIAVTRAQIDQIDAEQSATEAKLAQFPAYRAIRTQALTLPQLRAALRPGEGYWKLTIVGDSIYGLLVTPDHTLGWKVPVSPDELVRRVDAIRSTISIIENGQAITSPFDVPTDRQLYLDLAGPAAADLPRLHHLIFEPDGAMQRLPVTLLIDDQAGVDSYLARIKDPQADAFDMTGIDWLGGRVAVSTALSARSFRDVRATPPSVAVHAYLGLGHNVPVTVSPPIDADMARAGDCSWPLATWNHPIAAAELYSARKVVGADQARVVTDAAFSDTRIIADQSLADYRIVHFATHGLVTAPHPGCPAQPALLTSFGGKGSDGLLSFGEIYGLHLDADLVVLSACDTAGTADIATTRAAGIATGGGNAMDGLVRAFIGAGARSVLASHWPAPDDFQATEHLIDGLFTAPPGTPAAEAMRIAERRLMAVAVTSHPYYWAGFALIGDGDQPVLRRP